MSCLDVPISPHDAWVHKGFWQTAKFIESELEYVTCMCLCAVVSSLHRAYSRLDLLRNVESLALNRRSTGAAGGSEAKDQVRLLILCSVFVRVLYCACCVAPIAAPAP
jgi:hypothetical protein